MRSLRDESAHEVRSARENVLQPMCHSCVIAGGGERPSVTQEIAHYRTSASSQAPHSARDYARITLHSTAIPVMADAWARQAFRRITAV